jgi:hypothetical protein
MEGGTAWDLQMGVEVNLREFRGVRCSGHCAVGATLLRMPGQLRAGRAVGVPARREAAGWLRGRLGEGVDPARPSWRGSSGSRGRADRWMSRAVGAGLAAGRAGRRREPCGRVQHVSRGQRTPIAAAAAAKNSRSGGRNCHPMPDVVRRAARRRTRAWCSAVHARKGGPGSACAVYIRSHVPTLAGWLNVAGKAWP